MAGSSLAGKESKRAVTRRFEFTVRHVGRISDGNLEINGCRNCAEAETKTTTRIQVSKSGVWAKNLSEILKVTSAEPSTRAKFEGAKAPSWIFKYQQGGTLQDPPKMAIRFPQIVYLR
jgi:hypothetical protein